MISTVGEIYTGKARSNQDLELVDSAYQLGNDKSNLPDSMTGPIPVPAQGEACQGTVKACCKLDAKYKTEDTSYLILLFLSCAGDMDGQGVERRICVSGC